MTRAWFLTAAILTGICSAGSLLAQTYTVSAKPGALNFIQGEVSVNGDPVWRANIRSTFLNANDVIEVGKGNAEVLLTPGVFLRLGNQSQVRMIKPSLVDTQIEVVSGESMIEVIDIVPGSSVAVMDHGSSTTLLKNGLFRFTENTIAVLDGKADVAFGDRRIVLGKDKVVQIGDAMRASKVDLNQPDDLYSWSNNRSLTNAAASYAGSTAAYNSGGYGYSGYSNPGWYWASGFNSYVWFPTNGAFYSPFGWGFYGPGLVSYAPIVYLNPSGYVNGAYYGGYYGYSGFPITTTNKPVSGPVAPVKSIASQMIVPVNPAHVGTDLALPTPAAMLSSRMTNQSMANFYGLRTANGSLPANIRNGQTFSNMSAASHAAVASSRVSSGWAGGSGGSSSSGYAASTPSSTFSSSGNGFGGNSGSMSSMARGGGASSGGGHAK